MNVLVVGCGGFGTNVTLAAVEQANEHQLVNMDYLLVDGSDSNVRELDLTEDNFWKVPHVDGQGKKRGKGAAAYVNFVSENIHRMPEADMYVIVYSLTGGSGSVLGPEINRQLMLDGRNTVNVVLSTDDSKEDVKNAFNTLTGLANNVRMLERPIHFMIEESSSGTRSQVDEAVIGNILSAATICGIPHHGLDSTDINSWLDYQQHDVTPALTMIERFDDSASLEKLSGSVITILSLLETSDSVVPKTGAVFNTDGVGKVDKDIHFVTTTKNMENLSRKITESHNEYLKIAKGLNVKDSFGSNTGDDTGAVY